MNNILFTDIDGVLNTVNRNQWNKTSIYFYNKLCLEFNLRPVVTSTWRTDHTIQQLQKVFTEKGILAPIYDYTPIFPDEGRGAEIEHWIFNNTIGKFIILDDNVRDINSFGLPNVVKCRGWVGFTEEEYNIARNILLK